MMKYLLFALTALLVACGNLEFPGVYKIPIEQGNILTQEMVDQLKPGMSKSQVEYVLGSPVIRDTFNNERWDYLYSIQPAKGERKQHRLSVFFVDGKLNTISGDFFPSVASDDDA
jgi:outer membrane protein assembly factor BamE